MPSNAPTIGLDVTAALHQQAGIGRSVRALTAALIKADFNAEWRLFAAAARPADAEKFPAGARFYPSILPERVHNRLWQRLRLPLPIEVWTGKLDLYHATDFSLPPARARTVLTVHDLSYERFPAETMPGMQAYLSTVVPRSARRADHVIAPSLSTKSDLINMYGIEPRKVTVVHHGVDARFSTEPGATDAHIHEKYGLPRAPFVLTVGTLQPRKNHARLVRAMAHVEAPLVIAGGRGWAYDDVRKEVERLGITDRVVFAGFIADEDLPALYRAAEVFAYPALYEGFGLPPLEAMACGTPVLTAETSSLPEVVGEAGLLVDPLDEEAIAQGIITLLDDTALRERLRAAGLAQAERFSWQRSALETWAVYDWVISSGG